MKRSNRAKRREALQRHDAERMRKARLEGESIAARRFEAHVKAHVEDIEALTSFVEVERQERQLVSAREIGHSPPRLTFANVPRLSFDADPALQSIRLVTSEVEAVPMALRLSNGATIRWWAWKEVGTGGAYGSSGRGWDDGRDVRSGELHHGR